MTELLNIYGAPGTGKTRKITEIALLAAQRYGPKRIAAVTYTRPVAAELKVRIATVLGMPTDEDTLKHELPYVGTLHSVAWHLRGAPPIMKRHHFREFCADVAIGAPPARGYDSTPDDIEAFWYTEATGREEGAIFQRLLALARHKRVGIEDVMDAAPLGMWHITAERMALIAKTYHQWKRDQRLVDFEDVLEEGLAAQPPVEVLICDEAQDNSRLMWAVLDTWLPRSQLFVTGGDAGQSIYSFNGADPLLFSERPGAWQMLNPSHRLTAAAAEYAKNVLAVGWDEPRFQGWTGVGGTPVDGSVFYLARTNRLLAGIESDLEAAGEPYVHFPGRAHAPWESNAATAYRTIARLQQGDFATADELRFVAKQIKAGLLPAERKRAIANFRDDDPGAMYSEVDAVRLVGPLAAAKRLLDHADYLTAVERRLGYRGLMLRPTTTVGTIHAAKGKEADEVNLVTSWATLPARSLWDEQGRRSEACVAYVAASRHRSRLNLITVPEGTAYPWPAP